MTQLSEGNGVQFKVENDESFGCKFKLPKELVSIIQKLDDKRLVKTEVKTYGKCGGMRFDLTFVDKKTNKKVLGPFNLPCCNLLSFLRNSDKLKEKVDSLENKVYKLCRRLQELECNECKKENDDQTHEATADQTGGDGDCDDTVVCNRADNGRTRKVYRIHLPKRKL